MVPCSHADPVAEAMHGKYMCLNIYNKRRYPALRDPEISYNWKLTKGPTTFRCSINGRHLTAIREFGRYLLMSTLFFRIIDTPCSCK